MRTKDDEEKNEEKAKDEEQEKGTGILRRGYLKAKNSAPLNRCAVKRKTKQNKIGNKCAEDKIEISDSRYLLSLHLARSRKKKREKK